MGERESSSVRFFESKVGAIKSVGLSKDDIRRLTTSGAIKTSSSVSVATEIWVRICHNDGMTAQELATATRTTPKHIEQIINFS